MRSDCFTQHAQFLILVIVIAAIIAQKARASVTNLSLTDWDSYLVSTAGFV